jgi:hypothetical protein
MKSNLIIYLSLLLFFTGCSKDDGPVPKSVGIERIPAPLITKDATGSQAIDVINLGSFSGKFKVGLYFPNDIPPQKMDIVVRKNSTTTKVLQAGVTTFPSTFTITAAQLAQLFGAPVALGDNYDIGADIYSQSGKKYEAFPAVGEPYGATGFAADHPGFSPSVTFSAICAYDPNLYQGNFVVVKDDWADTSPGDIIVLTKIDNTHFSFIYPTAVNPIPIVVTVNTLTNTPSIALQNVGTAWVYDSKPPAPTAKTTPGVANKIAPCDKTLSLNMTWTQNTGSYSNLVFSLRKQ